LFAQLFGSQKWREYGERKGEDIYDKETRREERRGKKKREEQIFS
jgi:hypothetical protein